ncbi:unnamed protein product [Didymodactylos carnosus]|uniref:HTH OST-type domain-containing protein n=1 Tax=Didymodactylos carnosus TaxID=1234261 RepID=A0A8S2DF78_9BILA|nr:unnamed protein product [Didymodactylos carnosus]CAF3692916.1 unnamed protein product [Didymodactylos carnosus]
MTTSSDYTSLKVHITAVLLSAKGGLTIEQFIKDYQTLVSRPLPFEEFGFKDVISLLRSMKDVCCIDERNGLIYGIGNENTAIIEKFVHEQKDRKRRGYPNIGGYHNNGYRNRGRNTVYRENSYREASASDVRSTAFRARPYQFNNSSLHSYNNFPYRSDNQQSTSMNHQSGISRTPVVSLI